jgi:hypothetical protein
VYADELHDLGYQLDFHVIGDAAVRTALNTVAAIPADDVDLRRHRATHAYLVDPDDLGRFADLGMVADLQQGPDAIATTYHEALVPLLGERAFDLIPTDDLVDAGALVTLSSDWDADPLPPFGTIQRVLTRDTHGLDDVEAAVRMMTIDPATALRHEDTTGSIEVGKQADYVVVDRDLFAVPVDTIGETTVLLTAVGGRIVHRDPDF